MNLKKLLLNSVKLLSASTVVLLSSSPISYASLYLKAFGGNTISSLQVEAESPFVVGGAFNISTDHKAVTTSNLFSPGASLGYLWNIYPKVNLGLEVGAERQIQKHTFKLDIDDTGTGMLEVPNLNLQLQNNFRAITALVLEISRSFYIKTGPSVLNQKIKTSVRPSGDSGEISNKYSKELTENLIGAMFGTGFTYRLTKNFGLFTEYNYTYYPKKNIDDFIAPGTLIQSPTTPPDFYNTDRAIKLSQSDISIGFVFNT